LLEERHRGRNGNKLELVERLVDVYAAGVEYMTEDQRLFGRMSDKWIMASRKGDGGAMAVGYGNERLMLASLGVLLHENRASDAVFGLVVQAERVWLRMSPDAVCTIVDAKDEIGSRDGHFMYPFAGSLTEGQTALKK